MITPTLTSVLLGGIVALTACKTEGETEDFIGGTMTSSKPNGSAGGFSATLGADLAKNGSGSAMAGSAMAGSAMAGSAMAGSAMAGSAMAGSAMAGSAMAGSAMAGSAMAGSAMAGSAMAGSGSAIAGSAKPPAGSASNGSGAAPKVPAGSAMTGSAVAVGSGTSPPVVPTPNVARSRVPVVPPAEVAAIKLKLEPSWERDIGEAATISRNVDAVTRTVLFVFYYGYDDAAAPKDRELYIKWLAEKKLLLPANPTRPLLNRQRGAAWYLEGLDGSGAAAFRYVVNYGDKKLICHGPLYKDAGLADTRDEVIIQAKKICESISL